MEREPKIVLILLPRTCWRGQTFSFSLNHKIWLFYIPQVPTLLPIIYCLLNFFLWFLICFLLANMIPRLSSPFLILISPNLPGMDLVYWIWNLSMVWCKTCSIYVDLSSTAQLFLHYFTPMYIKINGHSDTLNFLLYMRNGERDG